MFALASLGKEPYRVEIELSGVKTCIEFDTGAAATLASEKTFKEIESQTRSIEVVKLYWLISQTIRKSEHYCEVWTTKRGIVSMFLEGTRPDSAGTRLAWQSEAGLEEIIND